MEARYRAMIKERQGQMQAYAREQFGLEMGDAPAGVDSRPAMEGAFFARAQGREDAYHRLCLEAHWQKGRRLDDLPTLTAIAAEAGLDAGAFRAAIDGGRYRAEFEADIALGRDIGIDGVPAFVFGNRYLVSGARPPEVLAQVVDRCVEEGLTGAPSDGGD
jgi:predicted DsbA family dithiol-disulfide isomerase